MFKLYNDVTVTPLPAGVNISLPWMEGTVGVVSPTSDLDHFRKDFYDQLELRNRLNAETIIKFPFCYLLPRKLEGISTPTLKPNFKTASYSSLKGLIYELSEEYDIQLGSVLELLPSTWNWDVENAKQMALVDDDRYDPLSVYSLIRELRHLDNGIDSQSYRQNLNRLLRQNESRFFEVIGISLTQGEYVTRKCTDSLSPALETFKEAYYEVKTFIREEEGHNVYIQQSLDELPCNQENLPLFDETKFLMVVLKHTAKYHPLAFSCIVSQFEEPGYQPYDPTAELLKKSSRPEAANGIQTHFNINKLGNHAETGAEFALNLQAITSDELLMAMRYCELCNRLLIAIETRLYDASK